MKDYNTVALIILILFISAAFCSAGDSYSQLYNPHGVKILSPTKEQEVPINIQNFTVEGVSTDNSTNNCEVSLLLNGITPYVKVSSMGQNGPGDFSAWEQIFNSNLHLNVGENKLTAKLLCSDVKSNQITKYHSVNFTGTNETSSTPITKVLNPPSTRGDISPTNITEIVESESTSSDNETSSTPITKVLNPPSTRGDISPTNITEIVESESTSSDNETSSTPITKVLNPPSTRGDISPTNITEIVESESTSSDLDEQTEFMSRDQVVRNITSGPVIIPPAESQESSMFDTSVNDFVIIPNATSSGSASDNGTSPSIVIPPAESQESSMFDPSVNNSVIIPNATSSGSASDNGTSLTVLIPSSENGSSATPVAPLNNQSYSPADQVSKEISEQPESTDEEKDDIPLIFPTPSPRVTIDDNRDESVMNTPVQNLSPVVRVEINNTKIEEGSLIMLNATQSYSNDGPILSNAWKQLTSQPLEYIDGLNMPILKFRAPYVSQDTPLEFEISVSDAHGRSSNGIVHVVVSDVTSQRSNANTSSNILNQTVSEPHIGGVSSNVKIPGSSESNFTGSPTASNAIASQSENQTQQTVVASSPSKGDDNSTSIKTMAGVDQIVNEGMEVFLNGDSTSTNSSQLSYEWRQVGGDVKVSLGQQNAKQISFLAPAVEKDSKLTFRFIASADGTQVSSDEVNITINDIPQNLEKNESSDSQDEVMSENDDNDDDDDN